VTRPAEESAEPVLEAAPPVLEPEDEEARRVELPLEPSDEPVVTAPVSVPLPVTIVALSGALTTTVVELPTDTSKEVREREMLIKR
jgi:hypothetical protein